MQAGLQWSFPCQSQVILTRGVEGGSFECFNRTSSQEAFEENPKKDGQSPICFFSTPRLFFVFLKKVSRLFPLFGRSFVDGRGLEPPDSSLPLDGATTVSVMEPASHRSEHHAPDDVSEVSDVI